MNIQGENFFYFQRFLQFYPNNNIILIKNCLYELKTKFVISSTVTFLIKSAELKCTMKFAAYLPSNQSSVPSNQSELPVYIWLSGMIYLLLCTFFEKKRWQIYLY